MYHSTYVAGQLEGMEKGKKIGLLQGLEKGKEIGKEEGKLEEKKAIARALLAILDIETLAQKTGLPIEDMQTLI